MTAMNWRMSRPLLAVLATLALSACTTTMGSSSDQHMEKGGMSMPSCPCCEHMKNMQAGDQKPCCCSGMMDGKEGGGCCGGGEGMMCQPKK